MKIYGWLRNELLYGGLDKESFRRVKEAVSDRNRKTLIRWSIAIGLLYIAAVILFNGFESPLGAPILISTLVISALALLCTTVLYKRFPQATSIAKFVWELSVLGNAVALSVFHSPERDCSTIVIMTLMPTVFIEGMAVSIVFEAATIAFFILLGQLGYIAPDPYQWGLPLICFYAVVGIMNGHFINKSRFERYVYADSAKKLAEIQQNYNEELKKEVEEKTAGIVALHDKFILGMATMVESRDNSTGGHIKRTSDVVRFLMDAIRETGTFQLSEGFCEKVIKAAPMHDLGKIAVDDVILRKPGRYTPEEFEKMKVHAAEGARIVHEVLADTADEEFMRIAENVAHFHHERFDGSGYPDQLKGDHIPLEARIMAIADVYDALVSKRVYKESYSFEKADRIILEGMGTQFDPALKPCYELARPQLEAYYSGVLETS